MARVSELVSRIRLIDRKGEDCNRQILIANKLSKINHLIGCF